MRFVRHLFFLFLAFGSFGISTARAFFYHRKKAFDDLDLGQKRLAPKERRRLRHYFFGTGFVHLIFAVLHGRTRNRLEKKRFTNLAALAFFFDDLTDTARKNGAPDLVFEKFEPEKFAAATDERGLALHFFENLKKTLSAEAFADFQGDLTRLFALETRGRQQSDEPIAADELLFLTAEKGGLAVRLFRRALDEKMTAAEADFAYQFGAFVQLSDDAVDLWQDGQKGVQTLPVFWAKKGRIAAFSALFEHQTALLHEKMDALGLPRWRVETAKRVLAIGAAVVRLNLDHFEKLEKTTGILPLADRQKMVIDMDKTANRVAAIRRMFSDF